MAVFPTVGRSTSQAEGEAGEDRALQYLRGRGLVLVERNFRVKGGEIDLIMRDKGVLVFVEVRKRKPGRYGDAASSVTPKKQARIALAAMLYLQRCEALPPCRFDVVAIDGENINWLTNVIVA